MSQPQLERGIRLVRLGALANALLALVKGGAGVVGHSQALIADAVESLADVAGSLLVWGSLRFSIRSADQDHPYGHGKAQPLAAAITGLMLWLAALAIIYHAVAEIQLPRSAPALFTLPVLLSVIGVKYWFSRRVGGAAELSGSAAIEADAWHHHSDMITSLAALVGISISLIGGPDWSWADPAAAILAAGMIGFNGWHIISPAVHELMDGAPPELLIETCTAAARAVPGVLLIEQLKARKVGTSYLLDMHVQADPQLSLHEAHILSGRVKGAVRKAVPQVENVLVHMEPFEGES